MRAPGPPPLAELPPASPGPPLRVEGLERRFGSQRALAGLSFVVAAGEIYGLLGPNGADKTTALRIVAGLLRADLGRVWVEGLDVGAAPRLAARRMGFLTGSAGLYARLTGREVLTYVGALYGLDEARIEARIGALARALELESFLDRRCETLSTGQRQRVSIARAVIHDPRVVILDEPTSGLDVIASQSLRAYVLAARAAGCAVVLSTHYLAEAELMCDRVGFLHEGRLVSEGTPAALRAETGTDSLERAFLRVVGLAASAPEPLAGARA